MLSASPNAAAAVQAHTGSMAITGTGPAVEARDLVKTYKGGVRALDGVSFRVEPGSVFGLLGPNGAGKSTTVKILTTLSRPDSGSAIVNGLDVLRQPDAVRRSIGCVGQQSAVDLTATGRENITLQARIYGLRGRELRIRDGKRKAVMALKLLNFTVVAAGDSYNDTAMLGEAHCGVLFHPPENVIREFPQFPVTLSYGELRREIDKGFLAIDTQVKETA